MSPIPPRPVLPNGCGYRYSLRTSIAAREAKEWLPFCTRDGDVWMDPRYLQAVETSLASGSKFWNLVMQHGAEPVAAAFVSLYAIDSLLFVQGRMKEIIQWSRSTGGDSTG